MSIWKTWPELRQIIKDRQTVFFGRGEWVEKSLPYADFNLAFVVDNNKNEQGTREHGVDVSSPERLREALLLGQKYYIVISTTDFLSVAKQLQDYGFVPGEDFCVTPPMHNRKILSDINAFSKKVIFSSYDPDVAAENRGGGLYVFDTASLHYEKKVAGVTHGFGQLGKNFYVIDDNVGIRVFDETLDHELDLIEFPLKSRPHGMAVQQSTGYLFVAFSSKDAIGVFDTKLRRQIDQISISPKFAQCETAQHHINDLFVDGDVLYISLFSLTGNWKRSVFDGGILEYDLSRGVVVGPIANNLWMPHSVKMLDGNLCYLDSMRGNLHLTTHKVASQFNGFVRGLDFDGQFYLVGQSVHRYFDRMKDFSNNIALNAGFFLFENESKGCKFFSLPLLTDVHTLMVLDK